jgi:uncharacterized protein YoxC
MNTHKPLLGLLASSLILAVGSGQNAWANDEKSAPVKTPAPTYRLWPSLTYRITDPNPAEATHNGKGRLGFLSTRIDMGSTFSVTQTAEDFGSLTQRIQQLTLPSGTNTTPSNSQVDDIETLINRSLNPLQKGGRVDYEVEALIARFDGAPFSGLQIADRPVTLGLSLGLEGRGFFSTQFSSSFSSGVKGLSSTLPDLLGSSSEISIGRLSSRANEVIRSANGLTSNIQTLTQTGARIMQNPQNASPQDIQQVSNQVSGIIQGVDALTTPARELTASASQTTKTASDIFKALKEATSGGVNSEATLDLHGTLGLSAGYPVIENENFRLSLGTNLKLFVLPTSIPLNDLGIQSTGSGSVLGNIRLNRISGLNSLDQAQSTLTQMDEAIGEINSLVDQANEVKDSLQRAQQTVTTDNLGQLATQATALLQQVDETNNQLTRTNTEVNQALQGVNGLQQTLLQDLRSVRLEGQMTTPGGAGFGLDLGAEAVIMKNLRLGLLLQNPVVLWQGTEKPFEVDINGKLTIHDDQAKSVNYTAGTPFSVLLSGQYGFDELLPEFPGLTVNGLFEFVANGRTPGLSISAQKQFGPGYVGLGGRLGGITSSIFLQAGLRTTGMFGLDFLLGIAPGGTGIPAQGLSALSTGGLNFYLLF